MEAAVPLELPVGHLDHHLQCPTVQVAMYETLMTTWTNQALKSGCQRPLLLHNLLIIPCLIVAARFSFQSKSSNTLRPPSITPSSSGHFTTVMVLSTGPGSGSSTSSRTLCFRISTISSSVTCWWWGVQQLEVIFSTVFTNSRLI